MATITLRSCRLFIILSTISQVKSLLCLIRIACLAYLCHKFTMNICMFMSVFFKFVWFFFLYYTIRIFLANSLYMTEIFWVVSISEDTHQMVGLLGVRFSIALEYCMYWNITSMLSSILVLSMDYKCFFLKKNATWAVF